MTKNYGIFFATYLHLVAKSIGVDEAFEDFNCRFVNQDAKLIGS